MMKIMVISDIHCEKSFFHGINESLAWVDAYSIPEVNIGVKVYSLPQPTT